MFWLKIFCDTQNINKALVKESYNDSIDSNLKFIIKYPNFNGCFDDYYKNLDDKIKNDILICLHSITRMKKLAHIDLLMNIKNILID